MSLRDEQNKIKEVDFIIEEIYSYMVDYYLWIEGNITGHDDIKY